VASRQRLEQASGFAERLRGQGWETFTVPTQVPGRGVTYRVYVGRFESEDAAAQAQKALRARGLKESPVLRALPLAIQVRDLSSPEQAAGAVQGLRNGGFSPELRRVGDANAKVTLVLEAFANQAETEPLTEFLRAHGLTPQVTER
jgi:hypothetical protein